MGSILYDFLNESVLFSDKYSERDYASLSDDELRTELDRYRAYCVANLQTLFTDLPDGGRNLRLFGGEEFQSLDRLKQAALYIDCMVVPDPLFRLTHQPSAQSGVFASYMGMPEPTSIDREAVVSAARMMRDARSMVAANYLKFLPSSLYSEPPANPPLRYSETQFSDSMPAGLLRLYLESADVRSMIREGGDWRVTDQFQVGRGIAIRFKRDSSRRLALFNYFEQRIVDFDETTGKFTAILSLPETPPSIAEFLAWVTQSVNSAAADHLRHLETEVGIAAGCNAMYTTTSPFSFDVMSAAFGTEVNIQNDATNLVLDIDFPILKEISIADLMLVRTEDGEAFDLFRRELERLLREVRLETDSSRRALKIQNAIHELTEVKLTEIDQAISRIKRRALADVGVATAALAASVATSGLTLFAAMVAAANGFKTYRDYQEKVRSNPAYFLWRVKK